MRQHKKKVEWKIIAFPQQFTGKDEKSAVYWTNMLLSVPLGYPETLK
jgi:hypothetical protein